VRRAAAALAVAVALVLAGCGGGGDGGGDALPKSGCGPDVRERLDARSSVHLIGDVPEPEYETDPPTSGPHRLGLWPKGVLTAPIDRPKQVAMLEGGAVLLQHNGLDGADRRRLETLAGGDVTVAPNPVVPDGGVIATAWLHKLTCRGVQPAAVRRFADRWAGKGA
jgi:hypothetical protein